MFGSKMKTDKNSAYKKPSPYSNDASTILPKKSANELDDNALESDSISCGPLLSRLLSAVLKDDNDKSELQSSKIIRDGGLPRTGGEDDIQSFRNNNNDSVDMTLSQENGPSVQTPDSD